MKSSFYLLTDTHFVSKNTWVDGKPFTFRERGDQIALKLSPEILDTYIEKIIEDTETDTVIFTGDNVNNGDMASHTDFKKRLERLTAAGKKVYVTYATHDYNGMGDDENFFKACRYTETGTEPIDCMRKSELFDFYFDYGAKQALSVHRESGSYCVKLCDGVRLIAIIDNGNGRSHCGLFDDGFSWLKKEIQNAKNDGDIVLIAVHHPVLPPTKIYPHLADFEMLGGYKKLQALMCEENVRVVFTGHTHVQNIQKYTDENGNWFYDVSTIALVNAAGKMRRITVDAESGNCSVTSVGIDKINGVDMGKKSVWEYLYYINSPGIFEKLIPLAASDYTAFLELAEGVLPVEKLKKHKALIRLAAKKAVKSNLSFAAKLGKSYKALTPEQKEYVKNEKLLSCVYEILRHIYAGNAPFSPDTAEYKVVTALARRAEKTVNRLNINAVKKIIPHASSLEEIAVGFLYNNRTGNDDEITFNLR